MALSDIVHLIEEYISNDDAPGAYIQEGSGRHEEGGKSFGSSGNSSSGSMNLGNIQAGVYSPEYYNQASSQMEWLFPTDWGGTTIGPKENQQETSDTEDSTSVVEPPVVKTPEPISAPEPEPKVESTPEPVYQPQQFNQTLLNKQSAQDNSKNNTNLPIEPTPSIEKLFQQNMQNLLAEQELQNTPAPTPTPTNDPSIFNWNWQNNNGVLQNLLNPAINFMNVPAPGPENYNFPGNTIPEVSTPTTVAPQEKLPPVNNLADAIAQVNAGNYRMMDNPANSYTLGDDYKTYMEFAADQGLTGNEAREYALDQALRGYQMEQERLAREAQNNIPVDYNNPINIENGIAPEDSIAVSGNDNYEWGADTYGEIPETPTLDEAKDVAKFIMNIITTPVVGPMAYFGLNPARTLKNGMKWFDDNAVPFINNGFNNFNNGLSTVLDAIPEVIEDNVVPFTNDAFNNLNNGLNTVLDAAEKGINSGLDFTKDAFVEPFLDNYLLPHVFPGYQSNLNLNDIVNNVGNDIKNLHKNDQPVPKQNSEQAPEQAPGQKEPSPVTLELMLGTPNGNNNNSGNNASNNDVPSQYQPTLETLIPDVQNEKYLMNLIDENNINNDLGQNAYEILSNYGGKSEGSYYRFDAPDSGLVINDDFRDLIATDQFTSAQNLGRVDFQLTGKKKGANEFDLNMEPYLNAHPENVETIRLTAKEFADKTDAFFEANPTLKKLVDDRVMTKDQIVNYFFKNVVIEDDKKKPKSNYYLPRSGGSRGGGGGGGGGGGRSGGYNNYSPSSNKTQNESRIHNIMKNWTF